MMTVYDKANLLLARQKIPHMAETRNKVNKKKSSQYTTQRETKQTS